LRKTKDIQRVCDNPFADEGSRVANSEKISGDIKDLDSLVFHEFMYTEEYMIDEPDIVDRGSARIAYRREMSGPITNGK
jgi:hypothetical protein